MSIKKNGQYMEGTWAAQRMIPTIDKTTYETVEGAIIAKQELVDNFEQQFGFSREMENPDSNYAYNLGLLDALKKEHGISEEGSIQNNQESQKENSEE